MQISELEEFRHQISMLKNKEDRRACEARLAYAEEHIPLATGHLKYAEKKYVEKHLAPKHVLELTPGWDERSYEDRAAQLRAEFPSSSEGLLAAQRVEENQANIWRMATDRLAQALEDQARAPMTKQEFMERRTAQQLSRTFQRSVDR